MIKRDDIVGCVDLPCVGIACGIDVTQGIVTDPVGDGVIGRNEAERTTRALTFDNGGTWDKWCRTEGAVI
jgi:hypothetical protein